MMLYCVLQMFSPNIAFQIHHLFMNNIASHLSAAMLCYFCTELFIKSLSTGACDNYKAKKSAKTVSLIFENGCGWPLIMILNSTIKDLQEFIMISYLMSLGYDILVIGV